MLFSGIGLIAGLGTAAYVAARQIRDVGTGTQQSQLRQIYLPQIQTETQNFRVFVEGRFSDFQQELLHTVANKAKEYHDSINDAINEIQKIKQQINIAVSKKVALQNQVNPLIKAKKDLEKIDV